MAPMRWFPGMMGWIFGEDEGFSVYARIGQNLKNVILPEKKILVLFSFCFIFDKYNWIFLVQMALCVLSLFLICYPPTLCSDGIKTNLIYSEENYNKLRLALLLYGVNISYLLITNVFG